MKRPLRMLDLVMAALLSRAAAYTYKGWVFVR
jgi:hypothetical protein